jgi:general stress protein 26
MIKRRKMNTIVNITGLTLKCLGASDENAIKRKRKGYYINLITVSSKEDPKEYKRQWTFLNKERKKLLDLKNKDRINFKRRERRKTEKGKILNSINSKKYREKNKRQLTNKYLERRRKDPNFKLLTILRVRIKDVLRGHSKSNSTIKVVGCTIEELWKHLESTFKPGMTRENHGKWHVDHIIPCSSFDLSKPEEQAKCFHYTNLQALWAHENLSKGSKFVA